MAPMHLAHHTQQSYPDSPLYVIITVTCTFMVCVCVCLPSDAKFLMAKQA